MRADGHRPPNRCAAYQRKDYVAAREAFAADNRRALAYAGEKKIPGAVGSDAHRLSEIGRAWLEIEEFTGRDDFVAAVCGGEVHGRLTGSAIHLVTRYDVFRKWLSRRRTKTPS